jgi:hypothetical protein
MVVSRPFNTHDIEIWVCKGGNFAGVLDECVCFDSISVQPTLLCESIRNKHYACINQDIAFASSIKRIPSPFLSLPLPCTHHAPRRDVDAHDAHPHAAAAPDLHLHVRRPPHALLRVEAVVLGHLLCVG